MASTSLARPKAVAVAPLPAALSGVGSGVGPGRLVPAAPGFLRVKAFDGGAGPRVRAALLRVGGRLGLESWIAVLKAAHEAPDQMAAQGVARLFVHLADSGALDALPDVERTSVRRWEPMIAGMIALGLRAREWVREPEEWAFKAGGREMLALLARHVLVKWEMPAFMDSVWRLDREMWAEYQDWYVHLGAGGAVSGASPLELSKAQARFFAEAPERYCLPLHGFRVQAFLEARVLGADVELARLLAETRLGDSRLVSGHKERRAFWASVVRYFIRHPGFPHRQFDTVIDYLSDMKVGWSEGVPPLMPGLSMKGRTPEALLRGMLLWREDRRRGELGNAVFKPCGRAGLELRDEDGKPTWRITELLSSKELQSESRAMSHCVKTYALACVSGSCSIWSLARVASDGRSLRRLTVEVGPAGRIVQARGRYNRWPMPAERQVLGQWAAAEKLELPNSAMGLRPDGQSIPRPR